MPFLLKKVRELVTSGQMDGQEYLLKMPNRSEGRQHHLRALQSPQIASHFTMPSEMETVSLGGPTVSLITQCSVWLIFEPSHADSFLIWCFLDQFSYHTHSELYWIVYSVLAESAYHLMSQQLVSTYGGKLPQCYSEEGLLWLFPFCRCTILMHAISHGYLPSLNARSG